MNDVVDQLREGDIYRWRYRDVRPDDHSWGRYHCCSCIAIVDRHGRLRDTYWFSGSDGRSFEQKDLPSLNLTYVGNMSELDKAREYQADYYDDADIVDLNHANSTQGNFYLRKGAQRSAKKMLEVARGRLAQSVSNERRSAERSEMLRQAISQIEAGDTSILILSLQ